MADDPVDGLRPCRFVAARSRPEQKYKRRAPVRRGNGLGNSQGAIGLLLRGQPVSGSSGGAQALVSVQRVARILRPRPVDVRPHWPPVPKGKLEAFPARRERLEE